MNSASYSPFSEPVGDQPVGKLRVRTGWSVNQPTLRSEGLHRLEASQPSDRLVAFNDEPVGLLTNRSSDQRTRTGWTLFKPHQPMLMNRFPFNRLGSLLPNQPVGTFCVRTGWSFRKWKICNSFNYGILCRAI